MRNLNMFGCIALIVMLAGCTSAAHVERDRTVNFNNFHTYAWTETKSDKDSNAVKISDLSERKIREAVDAEMIRTGWKESKHKPDVLLSYDIAIERTMKRDNNAMYSQPYSRLYYNPYTRRYSSFYFPSEFMGYNDSRRPVREGTITISMIDPRSDKTIWQGWTTGEVNSKNLTTKEIQNSIKTIFRRFDLAKN
ncbi:MAG TPA: DUF4136 domain-containing protein [Flavisolibacter sp.]|jgi:hypothetical protein|nr:DUF4136 domain-containing protein [Flavisolibacter sp.]